MFSFFKKKQVKKKVAKQQNKSGFLKKLINYRFDTSDYIVLKSPVRRESESGRLTSVSAATNGGSGLLPKEIVDEIKGGEVAVCFLGKDRAVVDVGDSTIYLSNKGKANITYKEVWRTRGSTSLFDDKDWVHKGKLPPRTKKKK